MTDLKRACLITFGCQMNEYDSGRLGRLLTDGGWILTDRREEADFIFFNTCSIRAKAAQRVINHLEQVRPLKKNNPQLLIGLGGCLAEQEGEALLAAAPWLDLVIGPQHLPALPGLLEKIQTDDRDDRRRSLTGAGANPAWSRENLAALGQGPSAPEARISSSVTIMQGCDNYCAYCVVPYLRGPELSRTAEDILDEVRHLVAAGVQDLTLLGQNVNSYGRGRAGGPTFPELLVQVAATGLRRLRFTTSHPKDLSPELVGLFRDLPPLCENLHLPIQSGSDQVLAAMGRGYTRDRYLQLVESLRAARPNLALTTDIIVGFPGETEADFLETMSLLETVTFDALFSFKYSNRPQTRASALAGQVPEEEKSRRLTYLQNRQKVITLAKNAAHLGQTLEVLVERPSGRYQGQLTGRARNFKLVHFDGPPELIGRLVPVSITEAWAASLRGRLIHA
ncbi:MAG: tRNA (N6-isopentenyl adenosine(37)-C2)-methylthiotransferase MiaB [Candidatus Adiutrix sp.]|jgi:tRNA-2-methylthio-N6-dimethylallyladenosine synthase|nr:tRNA (N6-isopentenyl adenosine(37)-C2)-methylthiotransferase MiaB [Candidatus Adiutrix sp.]